MRAHVAGRQVSISDDGRLSVALELHNKGQQTWSSGDGFAASYQVFDVETNNWLLDGPRTQFLKPVAPRDSTRVTLTVELPTDPGRYQVFVSPLQEDVAWFFERRSPFLLIDAEVSDGDVRVHRDTVVTLRSLRLQRLWRALGQAFTYPLATIIRHRSLIRSMVRRDIAGRYRASYAGLFWTVIHPLLMMLTYYFVFGIVLRTRFGDDSLPGGFLMYFMAGMLPWLAFSEAVGRAPTTVVEHASFVKKLLFPVETLPVNLVLAGLVSEAFGLAIFVAGLLAFGYPTSLTAFYLPLILLPQFFFTLGLCWLLSALGVFFRDLSQLIGFLLTVWFFTTPICYPEASLPQNYLWLFKLNPMYVFVQSYRAIFLELSAPPWRPLAVLSAVSVAAFVLGHAWFYKLKRSFADLV